MRKVKTIIISLMILMLLVGCTPKKTLEQKIAGAWSLSLASSVGTVTYTYDFKEDGKVDATISLAGQSKSASGTWKVDGENIVCSISGDSPSFTYKEDGDNVALFYQGIEMVRE